MFILLASSMALISCKKEEVVPEEEEAPPPSVQVVTSSFTASVDGNEFQQTILSIEEQAGGIVSVVASTPAGYPLLNITIPKSTNPGNYTFGGQFGSIRGLYVLGDGVDFEYAAGNGTGSMVITSHDKSLKVVEGTFSFTANPVSGSMSTDSYEITGGSFVIQY